MSAAADRNQMGMDVTIAELYRLYRSANARFYGQQLPEVQITVQAANSRAAYGWCTTRKVWTPAMQAGEPEPNDRVTDSPTPRYEINLCAEFLNRGPLPAAETLLHEMVHVHNLEGGVVDVSGFQYHNSRFKEAAEAHGLICEKVGRFGWAQTDLQPETALWVMGLNLNPGAFTLARELRKPLAPPGATLGSGGGRPVSDGTNGKLKRWACKCTNIRCATDLLAICHRCGQPFVLGAKANKRA